MISLSLLTQSTEAVEYTDCIPRNECPGYDTKQSDGEVFLELWGIQSTLSLTLFSGSLWPGDLAPDRVLSMSQIELFDI